MNTTHLPRKQNEQLYKRAHIPLTILFDELLSGAVVFILVAIGADKTVEVDEEEEGDDCALGFFGSGRSSVIAQPPPPAPVSLQ